MTEESGAFAVWTDSCAVVSRGDDSAWAASAVRWGRAALIPSEQHYVTLSILSPSMNTASSVHTHTTSRSLTLSLLDLPLSLSFKHT